jgi:hypothetical protein
VNVRLPHALGFAGALLLAPGLVTAAAGGDAAAKSATASLADSNVSGTAAGSEHIEILEHSAYWTDVLAVISSLDAANLGNQQPLLFVIRGTLRNTSPIACHHAALVFEVLDRDGRVVASENGYNRRAETLRPIDSPFPMVEEEHSIEPIPAGATDTFRMILVGSDTPPFTTYRVRVNTEEMVGGESPPSDW